MIAFSRSITGLRIAEQNLYVTSNNLSNVETDGYHRQRLNQYTFQSETRGGFSIGLGVDADSIKQTRLEFLETNYRNELAPYGEFKYKDKVYTSLQSIVGDDGSYLQDTLNDMWESFNELAKEYTTTIVGSYLRENSVALIAEFDGINDQLDKMQMELDNEVINTVSKINDYADKIAILNDQITRAESDGSLACELRDSRDSIISSLSELIDITAENVTNTCVNIRTSNGYLVIRNHTNKMMVDKNIPGSIFNNPVWADTGETVEVNSGELKGILDMRGGNVIGNLEHSSNGAAKEKMDIVVSFDTDMDFDTLQKSVKNFSNMLDMFNRQSVNYQLYLPTGKEVTAEGLTSFVNSLYIKASELKINASGANTVSDLLQFSDNLYGVDSQLSSDIWGYLDKNNINLTGFNSYINNPDLGIDNEVLVKMQELFDSYKADGGKTLQGFSEYLKNPKFSTEAADLQAYMVDYINTVPNFSLDAVNAYIAQTYNTGAVSQDIIDSQTPNVLANADVATYAKFRDDSNKFLMVFTDNKIGTDATRDSIATRMNEIGMSIIAVTTDDAKASWGELAEKTEGNVFDISELKTEEGAENLGISITRDFNSKLNGVSEENGIAFFRAGLNSLLNGLVREINGILRQGENGYEHRHGDQMLDENKNLVFDDAGNPVYYNLDLFIKIDEELPLQMGNIQINPLYDDVMNMPLSLSGDSGDFRIGNMLVDLTAADVFNSKDSYSTIEEHYANFILNFGQAANRALTGYETQTTVLNTAKDRINQVSAVSMDEELSNMVKFQHSYTASSKMIRVIDEMLETLINL